MRVAYEFDGDGGVFKVCSECGEGFAVQMGAGTVPWFVGSWCELCMEKLALACAEWQHDRRSDRRSDRPYKCVESRA